MKEVIATMNSLEQCIYPELKKMSAKEAYQRVYNQYNSIEDILWDEVFETVLKNTIGKKHLAIILEDENSAKYFEEKQVILNNQTDTSDKVDCNVFTHSFNQQKEKIERKAIKIK